MREMFWKTVSHYVVEEASKAVSVERGEHGDKAKYAVLVPGLELVRWP